MTEPNYATWTVRVHIQYPHSSRFVGLVVIHNGTGGWNFIDSTGYPLKTAGVVKKELERRLRLLSTGKYSDQGVFNCHYPWPEKYKDGRCVPRRLTKDLSTLNLGEIDLRTGKFPTWLQKKESLDHPPERVEGSGQVPAPGRTPPACRTASIVGASPGSQAQKRGNG